MFTVKRQVKYEQKGVRIRHCAWSLDRQLVCNFASWCRWLASSSALAFNHAASAGLVPARTRPMALATRNANREKERIVEWKNQRIEPKRTRDARRCCLFRPQACGQSGSRVCHGARWQSANCCGSDFGALRLMASTVGDGFVQRAGDNSKQLSRRKRRYLHFPSREQKYNNS